MTSARRLGWCLLLPPISVLVLRAWLAAGEPEFFEPWPLRYARSIGEHPWRSSLALALVLLAAAPRGEPKPDAGRREAK
jgi:hypothetical protein